MIEAHPGISAVQAASAAAGAIIGHDFCCISLSDLLTPREDILRRLDGAATADFVTALYNPRSQRRTDLIVEAKARFLFYRPKDTPVIVASNLGRNDERVQVVRLEDFDPQDVDMTTIVVIGASTSRAMPRGDGRTIAYTPRGYANKTGAEVPVEGPVETPPIAAKAPSTVGAEAIESATGVAEDLRAAPKAEESDTAYRSAIRAGVAFLRERARHAHLPESGGGPKPTETAIASNEPRRPRQ
jgi:hypothetical protein